MDRLNMLSCGLRRSKPSRSHQTSWEVLRSFSSRSRADLSRDLGWSPKRSHGDFARNFEEEVKVIAAEFKDL